MKNNAYKGFVVFILILFSTKYTLSQEVKIGTQIWSSENLNVTKFRNGDNIPVAKNAEEWKQASLNDKKPIMTYIGYDAKSGAKYGAMYNAYAVMDSRGLAPKGWHIASKEEWTKMKKFLGGDTIARRKLMNTTGWNTCFGYEKGSNSTGFNAIPGGNISWTGDIGEVGEVAKWWTATPHKGSISWGWSESIDHCGISIMTIVSEYSSGYYVRCVKD